MKRLVTFQVFSEASLAGESDLYEHILGKESIEHKYKIMQRLVEIKWMTVAYESVILKEATQYNIDTALQLIRFILSSYLNYASRRIK